MSSAATSFHLYRLAQFWVRGLSAIASAIFLGIVTIVLGLSEPAGHPPVVEYVQNNRSEALGFGGVLLVVTVVAVLILWRPADGGGSNPVPRVVFSTALSTLSTGLFIGLLALVLLRPAWCPTVICPPAKLVPITQAGGIHDDNLEVYYKAVQTTNYLIPVDPASYTISNLPRGVAAVRTDDASALPYRAIVNIHSLQQGRFGIVIEKVELLVQNVPPLAQPLNVWHAGAPAIYNHELFTVDYHGEPAGTALEATFAEQGGGFVQLEPGETDTLAIQINPKVTAELQFQVRITYRVTNESATHTLTLDHSFDTVFSNATNWHLYQIQNGHFVPATS